MRERYVEMRVIDGYYADDGTFFKDREECEKYENSARMVIYNKIKELRIAKTTVYDLLEEGSDECEIEIFRVDCHYTMELLNRYIALDDTSSTNPVKDCMIGQEIMLMWNYDRDTCYFVDTIDIFLSNILNNYERIKKKAV